MVTLQGFRIAIAVVTVLGTATAVTFFLAAPAVGSAHQMAVGDVDDLQPLPTAKLAWPLLRPTSHNLDPGPLSPLWVWLVWGILILGLPGALWWTLRANTLEQAVTRWVVGVSFHMAWAGIVATALFIGLVLPFSCL